MRNRADFLAGMACGFLVAMIAVGKLDVPSLGQQPAAGVPAVPDSAELATLYAEDQADRKGGDAREIDWSLVVPRDRAREARVKAIYGAGGLRTSKDHRRAAMILQHASAADDHLLAHELCVAALALGDRDARWLAAASEDRFLMNIGRPQRFGTQYRSKGPDEPMRLHEVAPEVSDGLRLVMGVPSLAEAREQEASLNPAPTSAKP